MNAPMEAADRRGASEAFVETAVRIGGDEMPMVGVLTTPLSRDAGSARGWGAVIVSGGAQNRVGSHRQFTLLARDLAAAGVCVLRFDLPGMGDSPGPLPHFDSAGPALDRAVAALRGFAPGVTRTLLWGLCDGATAALFHADGSAGAIDAVVAMNPWARTEAGRARAVIGTYYRGRLRSPTFWRDLVSGRIRIRSAVRGGMTQILSMGRGGGSRKGLESDQASLPSRLATVLDRATFDVLVLIGEDDLTGSEFDREVGRLGGLVARRVEVRRRPGADHGFSAPDDRRFSIEETLAVLGCDTSAKNEAEPKVDSHV